MIILQEKKLMLIFPPQIFSGIPFISNLSMAVYKTDSLQPVDENNIRNYLFLTSELQGNVESPEYYFQQNNSAVAEATDNLMLTHGWRRFRWEDALLTKKPLFEFSPEYEGHIVTGKVIDKNTGDPVEDVIAFLSVPARNFQLASAMSDAHGVIRFDVKNFFGDDGIAVQTANVQDSNYRIDINNPFSEKNSSYKIPEFDYKINLINVLRSNSINTQV